MSIWTTQARPEQINASMGSNMVTNLGIQITEVGEDYLCATMPVTDRSRQPFGLLHGGASAALAESIGSLAANLCIDAENSYAVGLSINCSHIRAVSEGEVHATAKPVHLGRSTQVWQIDITLPSGEMVCSSRLTMAVRTKS